MWPVSVTGLAALLTDGSTGSPAKGVIIPAGNVDAVRFAEPCGS